MKLVGIRCVLLDIIWLVLVGVCTVRSCVCACVVPAGVAEEFDVTLNESPMKVT